MPYMHKKAPPFLLKTYQMLQNPRLNHAIHWTDDGNGFIIANPTQFESNILPIYFKHGNMHSYIRQLNMYGFSKKRGQFRNYYHHEYFQRGEEQLINQIQRRVQNKGQKQSRMSIGSIDEQQTMHSHEPLLKINYLLLLQQIANLNIILNETTNEQLRDRLGSAMQEYTTVQNKLLLRLADAKEEENVLTSSTLKGLPQINDPLISHH